MSDKLHTVTFEIAGSEARNHMRILREFVGDIPRIQQEVPDNSLMNAVHAMALDDKIVARGDFISAMMRLPDSWRNCVMEYVQGTKPYNTTRFRHQSILHNFGRSSVTVVAAVKVIRQRNVEDGKYNDAWFNRPIRRVVEPGAEILLNQERAERALWKFGAFCKRLNRWEEIEPSIDKFPLVEVAFRSEWEPVAGPEFDGFEGDDDDEIPVTISESPLFAEKYAALLPKKQKRKRRGSGSAAPVRSEG